MRHQVSSFFFFALRVWSLWDAVTAYTIIYFDLFNGPLGQVYLVAIDQYFSPFAKTSSLYQDRHCSNISIIDPDDDRLPDLRV